MAKNVSKAETATTEKTNVKVADTKKNNVKKTATKVDTKVAEPETTAAAPAVKKPAVKKTTAAAPAVKAEKKTKKTTTAAPAVKKTKVEKPAVKAEKKTKKTATAAPAPKAEKKTKKTATAAPAPAVKAEKKSKVKAEKKTRVEKLDVVEVGLVCHVIKVAFDNGKKNRGHYSYLGKPTIDYLTGIGVTWKATGKHGYNFNVPRKNTKTFNKVMAIAEKFEGIALD